MSRLMPRRARSFGVVKMSLRFELEIEAPGVRLTTRPFLGWRSHAHASRRLQVATERAIQLALDLVLAALIALRTPADLGIGCSTRARIAQCREPRAEFRERAHGRTPRAADADALEADTPDPGVAPPVDRG